MEKNINLPVKLDSDYHFSRNEKDVYLNKIQSTIRDCTTDLEQVSARMKYIQSQGGWEKFWNKRENIDKIAEHLQKVTTVQQRSLDLIVLLLGATGRVKNDYNTIIESIEELSQSHSGSVEVLDYLVKIKNTVSHLKKRDELLESLITYTNDLRDSMERMNGILQNFKTEHNNQIGSIKSEQNKFMSSLRGLNNNQEQLKSKIKYIYQDMLDANGKLNKNIEQLNRDKIDLSEKIQKIVKSLLNLSDSLNEKIEKQDGIIQSYRKHIKWMWFSISTLIIVCVVLSIIHIVG